MDPMIQTNEGFYITEVNQYSKCPLEPSTNMVFDPRYTSVFEPGLDTGITELSMLEENGIGDQI